MSSEAQTSNVEMVSRLAQSGRIRTARLEEAFRAVLRHHFLPDVPLDRVYSGEAIVTRYGPNGLPTSSSSEPAVMAAMLEQLQPQPGDRVLEIGAGTGYNAAILAYLVGPHGEVTTVDIDEDLVREAQERLHRAGFSNVRVVARDGWLGIPEHAPYDRIEATVGLWDLSPSWFEQLRNGGILVAPLWFRPAFQASVAFRKESGCLRGISVEPAGFMRLRGPHAGPESYVRLDGWIASLEDPRPDQTAMLADLLMQTPRREPAPDLPQGLFIRLALEEPHVVSFQNAEDFHWGMSGIFDPAEPSLAVVELRRHGAPAQILAYGGDAALNRLRNAIAGSRPLDLRSLHVEALPAGSASSTQGGWVVRRFHFWFLIAEPTASDR